MEPLPVEDNNAPNDAPPAEHSARGSAAARDRAWAASWWAAVVALVAILLAAGIYFAAAGCPWPSICGPIVDDDLIQPRLNIALPAPTGDFVIEQTFTPTTNGLSEIELILVRYDTPPDSTQPNTGATLLLQLADNAGTVIATQTLRTDQTTHNQTYLLRLPPQAASAGRRYTLSISGSEGNQLSVWGYSLDVVDGGELMLRTAEGPRGGVPPQTDARELRFTTRSTLAAADALRIAASMLLSNARLIALTLFFLLMPGLLLLSAMGDHHWPAGVTWGAALALGVSVWPIVWYWVSLAGGRWSGPLLWTITLGGWVVVAVMAVRRLRRTRGRGRLSVDWPSVVVHALLLLLLLAGLSARLLAVRGLAFPAWVDSSRHGLITAVIIEQGRTPDGYAPLLPVERFPYHFGFHTIAASLLMMDPQPLPDLLLALGQLMNALVPLTLFAAGWMVTRRLEVGLMAALLVALPFFFPAYYATWGRMTQLAAMLVMPVLIALTWWVGRGWSRRWPLVGLLAAGLFLLHFRVFLFYVPFAVLALALHLLVRRRPWPLLKAGALGLALVLPRLRELLSITNPTQAVGAAIPGYNEFPTGYYDAGWERYFIWAAAAALGVVLVALLLRRRWAAFPLLLGLWVGSLFLLLAGERLGLPETYLVNLNSMYISLFVPLALLLAIVAARLWRGGAALSTKLPAGSAFAAEGLGAAVGLLAAALALFGARQQADILNPQTILAVPADRAALAWADANLPDDALVAVNSWLWLGGTWAAADGGAWLTPLTGLDATTPPIDYIYNPELERRVATFNEAATAITDWSTPDAAAFLREQGVTHIMVGQRGGFLDPAALVRNEALTLLYRADGVFIFSLGEEPG